MAGYFGFSRDWLSPFTTIDDGPKRLTIKCEDCGEVLYDGEPLSSSTARKEAHDFVYGKWEAHKSKCHDRYTERVIEAAAKGGK